MAGAGSKQSEDRMEIYHDEYGSGSNVHNGFVQIAGRDELFQKAHQ